MAAFFIAIFRIILVTPNLGWVVLFYCIVGPSNLESHAVTILDVPLTWGGVILITGSGALCIEFIKSTQVLTWWVGLEFFFSVSGLVSGVILLNKYRFFDTETFLILLIFEFADVVVGGIIMLKVALRDFGVTPGVGGNS